MADTVAVPRVKEPFLRFPEPLRPGDTIGVTAPSTGAIGPAAERIAFAIRWLEERGHVVLRGQYLSGGDHVSGPKQGRAAELTGMLCDPEIRAVVPPWGGETAIDLLDQLDWDEIARARPTWLVGFSDLSTLMLPLTLRTGLATLHGTNLADTPLAVPDGLLHWLDLAGSQRPVIQRDSGMVAGWYSFDEHPEATEWRVLGPGSWSLFGPPALDASGRLIGGCLDCVASLAGTPYGDVAAFGARFADEGLIVYLEVCEDTAYEVARKLHGLRYAGWFTHANAILIGRTQAPDGETLTQREAVLDALGGLGIPIVFDMEIGHVGPHLPLVNGALARVVVNDVAHEITQRLG